MRLLVASLTAVALLAVPAGTSGAAPTRSAKLTGPEQRWATPVVKLWNTMNAGLLVVGKQTTAANGSALIPGTKANGALLRTLAAFVACTPTMTKAKAPPSSRLVPFATTMKSACALLATGAHGVANGISTIYKKNNSSLGAAQIKAAFASFQQGSNKLATARKQLLAIGGKSSFTA
jgi:hypothetical protein